MWNPDWDSKTQEEAESGGENLETRLRRGSSCSLG